MAAGTVTTGAVVSPTVTTNDADPVFPWASVAVQFTDVVPSAKVLPEAGAHTGAIAPSTRSAAEAAKLTTAPDGPLASAVMGAGTVTTGAVVSTTVTSNVAVAVFPAPSVAVQSTDVVPSAKVLPEAGAHTGASAPSTRSAAEAAKLTTAPDAPLASAVMGAGTVTTGAVVSTTVT